MHNRIALNVFQSMCYRRCSEWSTNEENNSEQCFLWAFYAVCFFANDFQCCEMCARSSWCSHYMRIQIICIYTMKHPVFMDSEWNERSDNTYQRCRRHTFIQIKRSKDVQHCEQWTVNNVHTLHTQCPPHCRCRLTAVSVNIFILYWFWRHTMWTCESRWITNYVIIENSMAHNASKRFIFFVLFSFFFISWMSSSQKALINCQPCCWYFHSSDATPSRTHGRNHRFCKTWTRCSLITGIFFQKK